MAAQVHEVPVVAHGLRPAETYAQLCQALQALQSTATAVFDLVESRVESERGRLRAISSRIRSAEAKIASLTGSTKAITIYSSAKYPAQHNIDYEPVFGIRTARTDGPQQAIPSAIPFRGDRQARPQGTEEALELFRFFSAAANQAPIKDEKTERPRIPADLRSTANLLLFDTTESILDRPAAPQSGRSQQASPLRGQKPKEPKPKASPSKPPRTIIQGDVLAVDDLEQFAFRPTLEAVPALDLPSVLPDLPMIADISWTGGAEDEDGAGSLASERNAGSEPPPSSAPSPPPSTSDRATPPNPHPPVQTPHSDVSPTSASSSSSERTRPTPSPAAPPLPNDPPSVAAASSPPPGATTETTGRAPGLGRDAASGSQRSLSPPPAPPPPPPPPPKGEPSPPVPAIAGDSARQALLASIRSPGVRLRKVSDDRSRTPSPRREMMAALKDAPGSEGAGTRGRSASSPPPMGDMFAEMASHLMSRRLSMKGGLQSAGKEVERGATETAVRFASPPRHVEPSPQPLPVKTPALAALVAQRSTRKSIESDEEDDEWDD
ncbi:WASD domain containing protein [Klebsormidium nitens]|uniref:WASD domain containing protein n=1 Tax=Klebsormidium nitens TaxID=105231 RepID=A0A1Y1ICG5_KLENI|nr:WASD domain containing protein [Klebsormidium nitens]|eukprot:GAQ88655.1 WASD domain containing protein [Klebsormidium nitens]